MVLEIKTSHVVVIIQRNVSKTIPNNFIEFRGCWEVIKCKQHQEYEFGSRDRSLVRGEWVIGSFVDIFMQ